MEFYLNELIQYSVLFYYSRALFEGECLKDSAKAEMFIRKAYDHGLHFLDGCYPTNFANMQRVRLYFAKLLLEKGDWQPAKDLLFDNIKDAEIELSLRRGKNPSCGNNPKVQKCVAIANQIKHLSLTLLLLNLVYIQTGDQTKALDCLRTVSFLCTDVFGEQSSFVNDIAGYTASSIADVISSQQFEELFDEQKQLLAVMEHFDHFGLHEQNGGILAELANEDDPQTNELKQDGYRFGRDESKQFLKWSASLPNEMRHYQLLQISEYKQQFNPLVKTVNKIRLSNAFFGGSLLKDPKAARLEQEETTVRSQSSASKLYEVKSYKRALATEESALEAAGSLASGKHLLDSKRSLLSSTARYDSQGNLGKTASTQADKKKPKRKPKFTSEFQPAVMTTNQCRRR